MTQQSERPDEGKGERPDESERAADPRVELSRRERQIIEVLYRFGEATAADVRANIPDPPSNSAVRTLLRVLEEKGHVDHERRGRKYVYSPTKDRDEARTSAARRLVEIFFDDSVESAVATLLDLSADELDDEELERLARRIESAREEGR